MENNSQPLATESFSYSWLVADIKPHPYDDSFLNNLRQTTFPDEKEQNIFNFDIHVSESPANLAHADEIFSNGHIKPVFLNRSEENDLTRVSISVPSSPLFINASLEHETGEQRRSAPSSSKGILWKCYRFVKQRLGCSRKSNRVDDLVRKVYEVRSFSDDSFDEPRLSSGYAIKTDERVDFGYGLKKIESSPQASPWLSPARSCSEIESSIHEAILYCKRSIEK